MDLTEELIAQYLDLFAGREDVYAIRWEWGEEGSRKTAYVPSNYSGGKENTQKFVKGVVASIGTERFDRAAALAHLKGGHFLGVYPIHADSTVRFFALDFDKDEEEAWKAAFRQQQILSDEAGLITYIERSRSGKGYHLWGFLEEAVDAGVVRHALARFIEEQDTYDRMFPNQDGVTESCPLGNLIALPLFGPLAEERKGVFVEVGKDERPKEVEDQATFLGGVRRIAAAWIQELFETVSRSNGSAAAAIPIRSGHAEEGLKGAYKVVHEEVGCTWIRWCSEKPAEVSEPEWYALACQFAQLEGGRKLFHEFSAKDEVRYDPSDTDAKFDHAVERNAPHTCDYIKGNLNGPCSGCKTQYRGTVAHPFDLARVPFSELLGGIEERQHASTFESLLTVVIDETKELYRNRERHLGFQYGIPSLDKRTSLRPDDLIILAARPGMGKSALMSHVALHNARLNHNVYIFSMEMTGEQVMRRMIAAQAEVDVARFLDGKLGFREWRRIREAQRSLRERPLPIWVDDATYDSDSMINKAAELIGEHGPGIVMVDYLQFVESRPGESMYEKNSRVPHQFKQFAKALHVPVLALAQLNRTADGASPTSKTFDSWLEGSGKIEQVADVVIFIQGEKHRGNVRRVLSLHKERHREANHDVTVEFLPAQMLFREPASESWRGTPFLGEHAYSTHPVESGLRMVR